MKYHPNTDLSFIKDGLKSYVYVYDKSKEIGLFSWDYTKKRWRYVPHQ